MLWLWQQSLWFYKVLYFFSCFIFTSFKITKPIPQETIFFNPFENRRMEMHKDETRRDSESDDESIASSLPARRPLPPIRPDTLDLYGAGSSSGNMDNELASLLRIRWDDESTASSISSRRPLAPVQSNTLDLYGAGSTLENKDIGAGVNYLSSSDMTYKRKLI